MFKKCYKCSLSVKNCFCNEIQVIDSNIKIVILMHPKEAKHQKTGTGRLTHLALKDSELIIGINFSNNKRVNDLINDNSYFPLLLYPSANSLNIEDGLVNTTISNKKLLIFIIDGTWNHARIMMRESKFLYAIPHISFKKNYISKYFFKKQPKLNCLSTIESAYYLLITLKENKLVNQTANYENLMVIFQKMVNKQVQFFKGTDKNII